MKDILFYLLKIVIVLVLLVVFFMVGAMIGYAVVGEGSNPLDVFDQQLWQHVLDFFM
ncbi:DNA-directed RNA polymerase subunit beta [Dolosigranulum pigrum]|jgi:hypothetical protein|nr:DNA-directed RNA polymerase subunit beta [Dolosigranulum pigrum]QTJ59259.1 DNA-directed RNA polymerase subunit beta [Dolosigranulum pigrum]RAN55051.1 DNA-directed RNA polymerase subunit beta [Dolosigranulum pigrum]RAN57250.1 DNA-directed RNA polymerase subunit beta [Dolosigranulum pigrum]